MIFITFFSFPFLAFPFLSFPFSGTKRSRDPNRQKKNICIIIILANQQISNSMEKLCTEIRSNKTQNKKFTKKETKKKKQKQSRGLESGFTFFLRIVIAAADLVRISLASLRGLFILVTSRTFQAVLNTITFSPLLTWKFHLHGAFLGLPFVDLQNDTVTSGPGPTPAWNYFRSTLSTLVLPLFISLKTKYNLQ